MPRRVSPRTPHADRNLLTVVLALQRDFVDHEQLVEAPRSWLEDKQRPLHRVLLDLDSLRQREEFRQLGRKQDGE